MDHYLVAWANLRKRRLVRRAYVAVFVGTVIVAVAAGLPSGVVPLGQHLGTNLLMEAVGALLGFACLGLLVVGVRHFLPFVCPRCGQPFFHGLMSEIGPAKSCAECGLAVGVPESARPSRLGGLHRSSPIGAAEVPSPLWG